MDFLDPKKQRRHALLLLIGYGFITIAILIGTTVLLYQAYGFGIGKNGQVVQSGLLFVSTTPSGADIYLNNTKSPSRTDTRLSLVSGQYAMKLERTGYRTWEQTITLQGGTVEHYDYPFLFPKSLVTSDSTPVYAGAPPLVTQSPNLRWLLVEEPATPNTFDEYDMNNPKTKPVSITLPSTLFAANTTQTLTTIGWGSDNQHILLKDVDSTGKVSFILFDRTDPDQSVDLSSTLNVTPTSMMLVNGRYNDYYLYDGTTQTLSSITLGSTTPTTVLDHVITYEPYGTSTILYATSQPATPDKVSIDLLEGGKSYELRTVTAVANDTYLLALSQYSGALYVAVGAASEGKVYVYENPVSQLTATPAILIANDVMHVTNPNYIAFSTNSRLITVENGTNFSVYDAEYDQGYAYDTKTPLDAPQVHAQWMDGHHLDYVSGGKLVVFDFDDANQQTLMPASPDYQPFFDPNYKIADTFISDTANAQEFTLTTTALRTPADQ
jgi:hypothetical protein